MMRTTFVELFHLTFLFVISSVSGCGQLPQRQGRALNYEVVGFKLPAAMVYIEDKSAPSQVSNISTSEQQAVTFIQNIIMQSVENVLYQQGRGAGLSDDVISLILNQFDITVSYKPLKCDVIFTTQDGVGVVKPDMKNCQIISGIVINTCSKTMQKMVGGMMKDECPAANLEPITQMYLTVSGSITTTNIIMANWSTQMWQIVLNRALQSLTSGPLQSNFIGASINLK